MKFSYHNKIIGEHLQYFYEEETFELQKILNLLIFYILIFRNKLLNTP